MSSSLYRMAREEERSGMLSMVEASDSSSITCPLEGNKPRGRENKMTMKFKGVVPQQNGNWGAQIYANHRRIWLGTFKSEREAAMAYDSVAIKIRSKDCHRNFPWTKITTEEARFQQSYSSEILLDMIKDGSYQSRLEEYLTAHSYLFETNSDLTSEKTLARDQLCQKKLFQKELTPSDVGKLNRLVIPKKYAMKYFPRLSKIGKDSNFESDDTQLVFYDRTMRQWKFRYCYWKSSQSFVFTRGWNRFVMEKRLKVNDVVGFYSCNPGYDIADRGEFFLIDINSGDQNELRLELKFGFGQVFKQKKDEIQQQDSAQQTDEPEQKRFKLFGVSISQTRN